MKLYFIQINLEFKHLILHKGVGIVDNTKSVIRVSKFM